nr:hypothetical protein [uncultured Allomuricauda sp.]
MKTTILNVRLWIMALSAVLVISCSAEDGEDGVTGPQGPQGEQGIQGEQGPQGEQGEAGQDGQDGQDGEDGNANVQSQKFDVSSASGTSHAIATKLLSKDILSDGLALAYLNTDEAWYQIPNQRILNNDLSLIDVGTELKTELFTMYFLRDGVPFTIGANSLNTVKIVVIPSTSTNLLGKGKTAKTYNFERDNVDVGDYYEVMDYLGLEY